MRTLSPLIAVLFPLLAALAVPATADLGTARLQIAGTRLTVSPQSQTVPFDTSTVIATSLEGFDPTLGSLPNDMRVVADLSGPEVDGVVTLTSLPNEPLRIPRLRLEGEYLLENIRLVAGDELLVYAEPRSATVLVTQVLVTSVTSRPLTLSELQGYGVVIDPDNFQAFNLTFGFAVGDGGTLDYELQLPVLYDTFTGRPTILSSVISQLPGPSAASTQRFQPPRIQPFVLRLDPSSSGSVVMGGCTDLFASCGGGGAVALPGALVFPTDLSLLNQFFSVILLATNGAPAGDVLEIHDLTARVSLPPALRLAETEPPTYLGTPVPVRLPGADGVIGTGDDLSVLIAQATGRAEVLVEAVAEGTHIVEFDLAGTLRGLPQGPVPIAGKARGAVAVRDPDLAITISHPDVVRAGEDYSLLLSVTNTAAAPVNAVTLELDAAGLVGVQSVPGAATSHTIATLERGDAAVVEFRLRPQLTGPVIASAARAASVVAPTFRLRVGVGETDIPLSPTSILLPRSTDALPAPVVGSAMRLLGLGLSLASAPPSALNDDLPRVDRAAVDERVYQLTQAGRYLALGDDPFDSAAMLVAEWSGIRDGDWEWDRLRRTTEAGGEFTHQVATLMEAQQPSAPLAFERLGQRLAPLAPFVGALASGSGVGLEVASRTSGQRLAGLPRDVDRLRELPFAELFALNGDELALITVPEAAGYEVRVSTASTAAAADLTLLVPGLASAGPRRVSFATSSLQAGGVATVRFLPTDSTFTLEVDADGDGTVDTTIAGLVAPLSATPFEVVAAVQRVDVDVSGHLVEVLFSDDVDLASLDPVDPSHFELAGNLSNGGLSEVEREIVRAFGGGVGRLRGSRVVRVVLSNPVDPFATDPLTVRAVTSAGGASLVAQSVPLERTATQPGGPVEGQIIGADGTPVAGATVLLWEVDACPRCRDYCQRHKTAAAIADAAGRYRFDYVRQTECTDLFEVEAFDPANGDHALAQSRMRQATLPGSGSTAVSTQVDLRMFGRATLRGTVTFEDGSVPPRAEVVAYQASRGEGQLAVVDPFTGQYELRDLPVGTLSLVATDGEGTFTFATEELPSAGASVTRDFTLLRLAPPPTAELSGTVVAADLATPVVDAFVALYVDGQLVGVRRSAAEGAFAFGTVPAGLAEIEAFDGGSGLTGGSLFFDLFPDQRATVQVPLLDERGTVEGFVQQQGLGSTTPVAGAVVYVESSPLNTLTDATGYYRLEGVRAGTRRLVAVDPATGLRTADRVTVQPPTAGNPDPVARLDLTFPLTIEGGLTGLVLDPVGNPIPNATIHLASGSLTWYHETFTDFSGRFAIAGLGPGLYEVHALIGNEGTSGTVEIEYPGHTPSATLQIRKGSIEICVMERDSQGNLVPFPGTTALYYRTSVVRFGLVGLDTQQQFLQTGQGGSLQHCGLLSDVLAGSYEVYADNPFGGSASVRGTLVAHGQFIQHQLEIDSPGSIRGRVLLPDGVTPAVAAEVTLADPSFAGGQSVTTGADGVFLFALVAPRAGSMAVEVDHSSGLIFRQARTQVLLNRSGQQIEDVEIVLPIQGSVTGTVRDSFGAVVPGALVSLKEQNYPRRTLEANADNQGNFSFTNVFAGGLALSAQAPTLGGLGGKSSGEITQEDEAVVADIVLEDTAEITGRILSPVDGGAVSGAEVQLLLAGKLIDRATSDAAGGFHFQLLPLTTTSATYELCVLDPASGRQGRLSSIQLTANGQLLDLPVTLEARAPVLGTLREPASGGTIPGATVKLLTQSLIPLTTFSSTDIQGDFAFGGVPAGAFDLTAMEPVPGRRQAFAAGVVTVEDLPVTVDLTLEGSGSVTGTVLNAMGAPTGPFANPNVRILQDGKVVGATLGNPYQFDGLIVGRPFTLIADEIAGPHSGSSQAVVSEQGELVSLDVAMMPIGSVTVRVVEADGVTPVTGADIELTSTGFYGFARMLGNTGASDQITFNEVGEGRVAAYVNKNQLRASNSTFLTLDGELVALTVALEEAGTVTGSALLADGITPAAGATVVLTAIAGRIFTVVADSAGAFRFPAIPDGPITVKIQENLGPGFREVTGLLEVQPDGSVTGGALSVLVLDDFDPRVISISPVNGTTGLALSTVVVVEFSEAMATCEPRFPADTCVEIRPLIGPRVRTTSQSWSADRKTLTVTPPAPLDSATTYEIRIVEKRNCDPAGRCWPTRLISLFTTADVQPPVLIGSLPASGSSQVATDSQIQLFFSEPVAASSLSGAGLQLTDLTTGGGVTTTFLPATGYALQFTVSPQTLLADDHQYRLSLTGATDTSGNVISPATFIDFWTPDTLKPQLLSSAPAADAGFVAGDAITVSAEIVDERGVASVTLAFAGQSVELTSANGGPDQYQTTFRAPAVTVTGSQGVTVSATDLFGNSESWQWNLQISTNPNLAPPSAAWAACLSDGDRVQAGVAFNLGVDLADDQGIESYRLLVDGQIVETVTAAGETSISNTLVWTPSPSAAPGTPFALTLEVLDYAGNLTAVPLSVSLLEVAPWESGTLLAGPFAGSLSLPAGNYSLSASLVTLDALLLLEGARVTYTGLSSGLDLEITGEMRLQCGAQLDLSGRGLPAAAAGLPGAAPVGVAAALPPNVGGSHGGAGSIDPANSAQGAALGDPYDSPSEPTLPGASGASATQTSGAGGGALRLTVDQLVLGGRILARGGDAPFGAGAGGSVALHADRLSGGGEIDVSGGDTPAAFTDNFSDGAGGGGRAALWIGSVLDFDPALQVRVAGGVSYFRSLGQTLGRYAGAGTLFVHSPGSTHGRLALRNGLGVDGSTRLGRVTLLPSLGSGGILTASIEGGDLRVTADAPLGARWLGGWMVLADAAGTVLGTFQVAEVDDLGSLLLRGASTATAAATFHGEYRFDQIELSDGAGLDATDPVRVAQLVVDGEVALGSLSPVDTLTVRSGATVLPVADGLWRLSATTSMTVEAGAVIDASGAGYLGGVPDPATSGCGSSLPSQTGMAPPGVAGSAPPAGGSHGGSGMDFFGPTIAGEVFDSVYFPFLGGGGGGMRCKLSTADGAGGGAVWIETPQLILDGRVDVHGERADNITGAGAGGTVHLVVGSLSGNGFIDAEGGSSINQFGDLFCSQTYPAGGGRVAIYADDLIGFDPLSQVSVEGGGDKCALSPGRQTAPGTLFFYDTNAVPAVLGELIVARESAFILRADTVLPRLGSGLTANLQADTADPTALWIEPADGAERFALGVVGMWVRTASGDYRVIDQSADRRRLLLAGAAGQIGDGESYSGLYRLDRLTLRGGVTVEFRDQAEIGVVDDEGGLSQVIFLP